MHVFYVPEIRPEEALRCQALLPEEEAGHCLRVLRLTTGREILLTDGKGYFYRAALLAGNVKCCRAEILETIPTPLPWKTQIHIAVAPTKNMDRMEWLAEKATEIGINELSFLQCKCSERKMLKTERIEKILVSAMKQSLKTVLPTVNEMMPFEQFVRQPFGGQRFIAHCLPGEKTPLREAYRPGQDALVMIGPEGDFCEDEVLDALRNGFLPVSLGESRLRTETAALVACHTLQLLQCD
jgi:16S rRNA (uracil1498-N3)-methyltransferase